MEMSTDIVPTPSTVDLDYILMQLDAISETLDQLEGVNNSNDLAYLIDNTFTTNATDIFLMPLAYSQS